MKRTTKPITGIGLRIQFCGHDGTFMADVTECAGAVVVKAGTAPGSSAAFLAQLERPARDADAILVDFPTAACWDTSRGVFVVPATQLRRLQ